MKWLLHSVGIILFAFLVYRTDWDHLPHILRNTNWWLLLVICILHYALLWIKSARWRHLLTLQGVTVKSRDAFLYVLASTFVGTITPGRLGEFTKAIYLKRNNELNIGYGFASVLVDRLSDILLLAIMAAFGMILIAPWQGAESLGYLVLVGIFGGMLPLLHSRSLGWLRNKASSQADRLLPAMFKHALGQFRQGLQDLLVSRTLMTLPYTVAAMTIWFFQVWLLAFAMHLPFSALQILGAVSIASFAAFIPISVGGLGSRDAVLLLLLSTAAVPDSSILSYSLGLFLVFYVIAGIMCLPAWLWIEHNRR